VRVYGERRGDTLRVDIIKVLQQPDWEGIGQQQQRSTANPPALSPPLKNAFVSLTTAYTDTQGKARLTKADFIKPVMEVSSYGRWTTEWEFYGPYTVPNDCGGSFYDNIGKNGTAAMKAAGVDPAQFNQIQFNIGSVELRQERRRERDGPRDWPQLGSRPRSLLHRRGDAIADVLRLSGVRQPVHPDGER
jgi:hypothetical protein